MTPTQQWVLPKETPTHTLMWKFFQDFPGGPVIKDLPSHAGNLSDPCLGN